MIFDIRGIKVKKTLLFTLKKEEKIYLKRRRKWIRSKGFCSL